MQITLKTNFPDIRRKLDALQSDIRNKVLASALNKTTEQAKTQMGREITSEYNVTSAYVRERLRIKYASFKAGELGMEASLIGGNGRKRSANMIAFAEKMVTLAQARKRTKDGTLDQLRFKIKKIGGKKLIRGAFIGNDGRTVFVRVAGTVMDSRSKYGGTKHGEQIQARSTIDVPSMFNQKRINARVVAAIKDKFPTLFERDAKYFTDKFNQS